ncbi:SDR family oxidoreductase [Micromonospora chersina]|uniref:hypothetical protein n=1 Tax=Micromonospora chersina TaxID=47854 RepID=UPI0037128494
MGRPGLGKPLGWGGLRGPRPIATAARNLRRDNGPEAYAVQVDLATPDGVEQLAGAVTELGRPVDVLALNAGTT